MVGFFFLNHQSENLLTEEKLLQLLTLTWTWHSRKSILKVPPFPVISFSIETLQIFSPPSLDRPSELDLLRCSSGSLPSLRHLQTLLIEFFTFRVPQSVWLMDHLPDSVPSAFVLLTACVCCALLCSDWCLLRGCLSLSAKGWRKNKDARGDLRHMQVCVYAGKLSTLTF